jgi:hypothetical protein
MRQDRQDPDPPAQEVLARLPRCGAVKGTLAAAEANPSHRRDPLPLLVPGTAEPDPGRNDRQSELLYGVVGENRLWLAGLTVLHDCAVMATQSDTRRQTPVTRP